MEDLETLRGELDKLDDGITDLWIKRMSLVKNIAAYKAQTGKKITDGNREDEIIFRLSEKAPEELKLYLKEVYSSIFATSKAYQSVNLNLDSPTIKRVKELLRRIFKNR